MPLRVPSMETLLDSMFMRSMVSSTRLARASLMRSASSPMLSVTGISNLSTGTMRAGPRMGSELPLRLSRFFKDTSSWSSVACEAMTSCLALTTRFCDVISSGGATEPSSI